MKGYRHRMKKYFDDKKSKILELHGSVLRAKGHFLKNKGENLLRHAYNLRYQYQQPSKSQSVNL